MKRVKLLVVFMFALMLIAIRFVSSPAVSGQTSISAPTGVSATTNKYNNKVGIYWDTMRGATLYRIFRSTVNDPATATEIANTAMPFFFDTTGASGTTYFFWVRAENGSTTSAMSSVAQGARTGTATINPSLQPPQLSPVGNPMTAAKVYLGKALFWDEQLSSTKTIACGTCHRGATGGSDPRSVVNVLTTTNPGFDGLYSTPDDVIGSPGVPDNNADGTYNFTANYGLRSQVTGRKANSHINAAYAPNLFWDGRATGTFRDPLTNTVVLQNGGALESQVAGPPVSSVEMGHGARNWQDVANSVQSSKPLALASNVPAPLTAWIDGRTYPELFEEVFGTADVTPSKIALAVASYERTLFSDQAPIDLVDQGIAPLPANENRGRGVFGGNACAACHAGTLFSDQTFRNIGLRPANEDTGRFQVTGNQNNVNQFRVPSLRNVGLRSSFMHNGRFGTIEDVIEFYNRGGDFPNQPNFPAGLIQPRNLNNNQKADLAAFLRNALTDPRVAQELPPFDRPHLYTESTRVPAIVGTGVAGVNGQIPAAVAIEPPIVGNPSFSVAVGNAAPGANVVLVINSTDPGTASIPASGSFLRQTTSTNGSGAASVSVAIPDNAALVGQTFFGRWYITDAASASGFSVSPAFRFTVFGTASAPARAGFVDFDGDRKTDVSIFRPSVGEWWYTRSVDNSVRAMQFGVSTDKIVPGDFTGDGKTDVAFFRPSNGTWFILRSEDGSFYSLPFGAAGDIPSAGDFDGDGKADPAVYRPSAGTWFIQTQTQGTIIASFGAPTDLPQAADYDGDGKTDIAIFRQNGASGAEWWIAKSTGGVVAATFGNASDKPVPADFSGDGKADIAFFRPSTGEWFVLRSEDGSYYSVPFGAAGDLASPGDYDGDGKADTAVFRPSTATWYVNRTTAGIGIFQFGATTDMPVPNAFVP